jgi:hypothetical protein
MEAAQIAEQYGAPPQVAEAPEPEEFDDELSCDLLPHVPEIFKKFPNWVEWEAGTKTPLVSGPQLLAKAKTNDPSSWRAYKTVCENICAAKRPVRLGFVTDGERTGNVAGVDLDGARDPQTGNITPWAREILKLLGSTYCEVTPSKTGLRAWVIAELPEGVDKITKLALSDGYGNKVQVEVFGDGKYFTMTGDTIPESSNEVLALTPEKIKKLFDLLDYLEAKYPSASEQHKSEKAPRTRVVHRPDGTLAFELVPPDEGFKALSADLGWKPLIDRMNKMADSRFHGLNLEAGKLIYCPMPGHTPRSESLPYKPCFGLMPDGELVHCFGCDFTGDLVKTVREFDGGEDGGKIEYATMYDAARKICEQEALKFEDYFPPQAPKILQPEASVAASPDASKTNSTGVPTVDDPDDDSFEMSGDTFDTRVYERLANKPTAYPDPGEGDLVSQLAHRIVHGTNISLAHCREPLKAIVLHALDGHVLHPVYPELALRGDYFELGESDSGKTKGLEFALKSGKPILDMAGIYANSLFVYKSEGAFIRGFSPQGTLKTTKDGKTTGHPGHASQFLYVTEGNQIATCGDYFRAVFSLLMDLYDQTETGTSSLTNGDYKAENVKVSCVICFTPEDHDRTFAGKGSIGGGGHNRWAMVNPPENHDYDDKDWDRLPASIIQESEAALAKCVFSILTDSTASPIRLTEEPAAEQVRLEVKRILKTAGRVGKLDGLLCARTGVPGSHSHRETLRDDGRPSSIHQDVGGGPA